MSQPRIEMNRDNFAERADSWPWAGSLNDEDTNTASLNADLYTPV